MPRIGECMNCRLQQLQRGLKTAVSVRLLAVTRIEVEECFKDGTLVSLKNRGERKTIDMANKAPEPISLHLAELTASQFLDIWNKFDADGECHVPGRKAFLI